jgi:hypothetical protein
VAQQALRLRCVRSICCGALHHKKNSKLYFTVIIFMFRENLLNGSKFQADVAGAHRHILPDGFKSLLSYLFSRKEGKLRSVLTPLCNTKRKSDVRTLLHGLSANNF